MPRIGFSIERTLQAVQDSPHEASSRAQYARRTGQGGGQRHAGLALHGGSFAIVAVAGEAKLLVYDGPRFHLLGEMGVLAPLLGQPLPLLGHLDAVAGYTPHDGVVLVAADKRFLHL